VPLAEQYLPIDNSCAGKRTEFLAINGKKLIFSAYMFLGSDCVSMLFSA
jgi:hypothetical protein